MLEMMKNCKGQVMTEYAIMLAMSLGIVVLMVLLMAVFAEYGSNILYLISSNYN